MSQELEQGAREAAAEYLRDYVADKRLLLEVEIEQVILKHLSPLFSRLSQRNEELEAQAGAFRIALGRLRNCDVCYMTEALGEADKVLASTDAGKDLRDELADLEDELADLREKWEKTKGVLKSTAKLLDEGRIFEAKYAIDAFLSSSPGQAADAGGKESQ